MLFVLAYVFRLVWVRALVLNQGGGDLSKKGGHKMNKKQIESESSIL